ncbi:hypothetical protein ACFLXT_04830, partial [Chloroflexota bacterium]
MSSIEFKELLSPITIKGMELRNRIVMAPMGTMFSTGDSFVSQRLKDYYGERAKGGIGLITVEAGCVYYPEGKAIHHQLGLYDDKFIPGLKELVDVIHMHG